MHAVNLKAAWEILDADREPRPVRVSLPFGWDAIPWPDGRVPARARLVRRFGRPPADGAPSTFRLRLRGVSGVVAAELNGAPIAWSGEGDELVVEPAELLTRNVLAVLVDPSRTTADAPWGIEASLECG